MSENVRQRLAVIPGDGVGPEVVREAERILEVVGSLDPSVAFEIEYLDWGTERYLRAGAMLPQDGLEILRGFDAILLGVIGSPKVKDHITLRELILKLRLDFTSM